MTTTLAGYAPPGHVEPMNPSAVLKRQRIKAGVPQAELARRMNRDQAWVSRTERGAYAVSVADYLAWMQALGLTVSLEPVPDEDVIGRNYAKRSPRWTHRRSKHCLRWPS